MNLRDAWLLLGITSLVASAVGIGIGQEQAAGIGSQVTNSAVLFPSPQIIRPLDGVLPRSELLGGLLPSSLSSSEATQGNQQATTWAKTDVAVAPESADDASPATETTVAINPRNPRQVIAGAIDFGYAPASSPCCTRGNWATAIYVSRDGGSTWRDKQFVPVRKGCFAADPAVTFDASGRAYYAYLDYGCAEGELRVITSRNGGTTWSSPTVLAAGINNDKGCTFLDKNYIGSAPNSRTVYATWTNILTDCGPTYDGWPIYFSRSDNGGRSWTPPARVSASDDEFAQGSVPRVAPDGTVYVTYYRATPLSGCPSSVWTQVRGTPSSMEMVVARSKDLGRTWSHQVVAPVCDNMFQNPEQPVSLGNALSLPSLSIDSATGAIYVAWSNRDAPNATIKVIASTDRGESWSEPATLPGGPGESLFLPWIAADAGVVRLVYIAENGVGHYDVFYRESSDNGKTWTPPFRLSSATSCACYSPVRGPYMNSSFIGHYIGMDAAKGVVIPVWPDNRHPEGLQTIYARRGTY